MTQEFLLCITNLFNMVLEVIITAIRLEKQIKSVRIRNDEMKLSFTGHIFIENECS